MRMDHTGTGTIPVRSTASSTRWLVAKTTRWFNLGGAYKTFTLQCAKGTTVATSAFTVKLYGAVSTASTSPTLLATCTSANRTKFSTGSLAFNWIKVSSTKFTTAAGRQLRIEVCAAG